MRQTKFLKEVIKWIIAVLANGEATRRPSRRADAYGSASPLEIIFLITRYVPVCRDFTLVTASGFFVGGRRSARISAMPCRVFRPAMGPLRSTDKLFATRPVY